MSSGDAGSEDTWRQRTCVKVISCLTALIVIPSNVTFPKNMIDKNTDFFFLRSQWTVPTDKCSALVVTPGSCPYLWEDNRECYIWLFPKASISWKGDPTEELGHCQVRDTGEARKRAFSKSRWLDRWGPQRQRGWRRGSCCTSVWYVRQVEAQASSRQAWGGGRLERRVWTRSFAKTKHLGAVR